MKRQKAQPISKEFSEAIEKSCEEMQQYFDRFSEEGSTLVAVGGLRETKIIYHPDYPEIWAILNLDLAGRSGYAFIGNEDDPLGGMLFLDMQRLEAEKIADFGLVSH